MLNMRRFKLNDEANFLIFQHFIRFLFYDRTLYLEFQKTFNNLNVYNVPRTQPFSLFTDSNNILKTKI